MEVRIIISGCRDFTNYSRIKSELDAFMNYLYSTGFKKSDILLISGGARGVDSLAERYAKENHYKMKCFQADWDKHGRAAGPIRNEEMAKYAQKDGFCLSYLYAFWDGESRGTKNMIETAKRYKIPVTVINI